MPGILISGPAGGGKSQIARDLLREATEPTVYNKRRISRQSWLPFSFLSGDQAASTQSDLSWVVPIAERVRQSVITAANGLSGYLFDQPNAGRGSTYANALRNSGAAAILMPYRVHRAGSVAIT